MFYCRTILFALLPLFLLGGNGCKSSSDQSQVKDGPVPERIDVEESLAKALEADLSAAKAKNEALRATRSDLAEAQSFAERSSALSQHTERITEVSLALQKILERMRTKLQNATSNDPNAAHVSGAEFTAQMRVLDGLAQRGGRLDRLGAQSSQYALALQAGDPSRQALKEGVLREIDEISTSIEQVLITFRAWISAAGSGNTGGGGGGGAVAQEGGLRQATNPLYLEVFHNGEWRGVCDDSFDERAGRLACKQLGLGGFVRYQAGIAGPNPTKFWIDLSQACSGTEASLSQCPFTWGVNDCGPSEYVSVTCDGGQSAGGPSNGGGSTSNPPPVVVQPPPPPPPAGFTGCGSIRNEGECNDHWTSHRCWWAPSGRDGNGNIVSSCSQI